ncbi:ABC transporter permease [Halalkalibacter oceani]|uniref:ABC transporter permease n=1 Tax=Halalkalibacter oceani TaxID=1653776 RepID=UPI0033908B47
MRVRLPTKDTFYWLAGCLLLWELAAWSIRNVIPVANPETKWPYLFEVVIYSISNVPTLAQQGSITFSNALLGFSIGALVGIILALLMSLSQVFEKIVTPYIISSQMIPIIGLAPIVFGIVRDAELSRILMAAYVTFFPVTINMLSGLYGVKKEEQELFRSYASSKWFYYVKLAIPSSLPHLFSGLKLAAPLSMTAAMVVELMGAQDGIGVVMVSSLYYGSSQSNMFWATVLTSALIGMLAYLLISLLEKMITPWQPEFRGKERE